MYIFSIFTLAGGLAFFLYGMNVMSKGLEKMAGGRLERTLKKMTDNVFKSMLLGAGITIAIQSSSALTVMLVGLVNSGVMQLGQTIGVIMGSNIGTTLTAWILSLAGIESSNFFLRLLKPESFSPVVALVGVVMMMASRRQRRKDLGSIMVGFAVLMFGMELMSNAVEPLADMPQFAAMLTAFENPLLGVLVGAVFTGIIQSSAASVGILQALAMTGAINFGMAIPIIMGQNIGTCATALISSIGVNRNAKRVAMVHLSFNLIGTVFCLVVFYGIDYFWPFEFFGEPISAVGIAFCHTIFNVLNTLLLLPFIRHLEKLATAMVKDKPDEENFAFIDPRLLRTPSFAIAECSNMTARMARLAQETMGLAIEQMRNYDPERAQLIVDNENKLDTYEDKLGTYLVRVASHSISLEDSKTVSKLLHSIGDFERIGDHAVDLQAAAQELYEKELSFSQAAQSELAVLTEALEDILNASIDAWVSNDVAAASRIEPLEQVIDQLIEDVRLRHIERLQKGKCTIQLGFILSDVLTGCERVSDHCSNIAVCVIEIEHKSFNTHEYLRGIKGGDNVDFLTSFDEFSDKYILPEQPAAPPPEIVEQPQA